MKQCPLDGRSAVSASDVASRTSLAHFIAQLRHASTHLLNGYQTQVRTQDSSREQGLALAKSRRANLDDEFIQQTGIVELAGKVATSDDPDVLATGRRLHFRVRRLHVAVDEPNVCATDCWKTATGKYPCRLAVRPR